MSDKVSETLHPSDEPKNKGNSSLPYKVAEIKQVPLKQFYIVEYPGYIKHLDKALKTLGGLQQISKAFLSPQHSTVQLRFRDDPFSHSINGDVVSTSNLLLKVVIKRRKKKNQIHSSSAPTDSQDSKLVSAEIIGMADFQYLAPLDHPFTKFRKDLDSFNVEEFSRYNWDEAVENDTSTLCIFPPPCFSRNECPADYRYMQNSAVVKVLIKHKDKPPEMKLVHRDQWIKSLGGAIPFPNKNIPTQPTPEAVADGVKIPESTLDTLRKLFEERPIWLRIALVSTLEEKDSRHLKIALPLLSYSFSNGPWRDLYIRYGYDPQKTPASRMFQILDVRSFSKQKALTRGKRLLETLKPEILVKKESAAPARSHILDGNESRANGLYQLIDIKDSDVKSILESKGSIRVNCDNRYGWFKKECIEKVRAVIRRKLDRLQSQETFRAYELLTAIPNKVKMEEDEQINSQVDQLMATLQEVEAGEGVEYELDGVESFEYEDYEDEED